MCVISASVCINAIKDYEPRSELYEQKGYHVLKNVTFFLKISNGWLIFLSLVVVIYQILATTHLFEPIKLMKIKVHLGNSLWYLSTIIVSTMSCVCMHVRVYTSII